MRNIKAFVHLVITLSIQWLVLLPLCIYWIRKIYIARRSLIMKKRYIDGSLYACIFLACWIFLEFPTALIEAFIAISGHEDNRSFFIYRCFQLWLYPICAQGAVYALLYRFWMIYFEFIYAESLDHQQWKMQLNPQGCSIKEQWIIQHRKDYGNPKWIRIRIAFVYVLVTILTNTLRELSKFGVVPMDVADFTDSALYLAPLITIFVLWCKMPAFADSFMVRDELKWIIIIYIIALLWNVSLVTFFMVDDWVNLYWNEAIWFWCILFVCFSLIFVQTQYILMRIQRNSGYFRNILALHQFDRTQTDISLSGNSYNNSFNNSTTQTQQNTSTRVRLCEVLEDKMKFNLFMNHITTELSTECIYSFIEFSQFQMLLQSDETFMVKIKQQTLSPNDDNTLNDGSNNEKICRFVPLKSKNKNKDCYDKITLLDEDTIPVSHIVYIQEYEDVKSNLDRYKRITISLAEKYIHDSGVFCININYNTRLDIMEWINTYCYDDNKEFTTEQYCEMYHLFEKCRREMYKLMQHILTRFVKTGPYLALSKQSE